MVGERENCYFRMLFDFNSFKYVFVIVVDRFYSFAAFLYWIPSYEIVRGLEFDLSIDKIQIIDLDMMWYVSASDI